MKRSFLLAIASALTMLVVALAFAATSLARSARTTRVSVSSAGAQGTGAYDRLRVYTSSISASGRFVALVSGASNLVPGDTNGRADIFVHNRRGGNTSRVSLSSTGAQDDYDSDFPSISADARYVAFQSVSALVPSDHNGSYDIFVRDRRTGKTRRVSVNSAGVEANEHSEGASISADGRYVAFESNASNLVPGQYRDRRPDVFVRDLKRHKTELASRSSTGEQGRRYGAGPSISADGRYVAFYSKASNLVRGDGNGMFDVFVRDLKARRTKLVSRSSTGRQGNLHSADPSISADGRYVAFWSKASNLVRGDTNRSADVFVRDRKAHKTKRVSLSSNEKQGNKGSSAPSISANGRFVAFRSSASNLVRRDTNRSFDVFVRDLRSGKTKRVSVSRAGRQGNGNSSYPSISARGRFVAFGSRASNLVRGDTNGSADVFVRGPLP